MQKGFTILGIIIGLLVIGGGVYLYLKPDVSNDTGFLQSQEEANRQDVNEDNSDDTQYVRRDNNEVNSANLLELIFPNEGDDVPFSDIVMAGDLHYRWRVTDDNYAPSANGYANLINENGDVVRNEGIVGAIEYEINTFFKTFVGQNNIMPGSKYKVRVCDYVLGNNVCDESDGFFTVVSGPIGIYTRIKESSEEILLALESDDMETFQKLVHPTKGVRFSKDGVVSENDLFFTPEAIEKTLSENPVLLWGYMDGSGKPIEMTFRDYISQYSEIDYLNAPQIAYGEALRPSANTINNIEEKYPNAHFMSYHYPYTTTYTNSEGQEVPQEMSWKTLNLVFEEYQGTYYLVGIVQDNWTI